MPESPNQTIEEKRQSLKDRIVFPYSIKIQEPISDNERNNQRIDDTVNALIADPDLENLYLETILHGNYSSLKFKTKQQVKKLRQMYNREPLIGNDGFKGFLGRLRSRSNRQKKLMEFEAFVQSLSPIRADSNLDIELFQSPRMSSRHENTGQGYDIPVWADNYVYASFDGIPHNLTRGHLSDPSHTSDEEIDYVEIAENIDYKPGMEYDFSKNMRPAIAKHLGLRLLDEDDFGERAELVMQDVADIGPLAQKCGKPDIKIYLDNVFDYKQGRELLTLWMAHVFQDVDEARKFFQANAGSRIIAEGWFKEGQYTGLSQTRLEEIRLKSMEIFHEIGIIPPLDLEIRIRESAAIREGW